MRNFLLFLLLTIYSTYNISAQETTDSSKVVRILSFNILHGATTKDDFDLDAIAKVIMDVNPDFVAMQEVDFKTNRAKQYDLVTELGWRTKLAPLFARAMKYDGGEYGEGILTKYSILSSRNVALPHAEGKEPRAAVEIVTTIAEDTIAFVGTHLEHTRDETDRVAQAKKINEVFSKNTYPTILAGDLNAEPGSETINLLEEVWASAYNKENPQPTYPSDNPRIKIDYVMFFPKHRWRIVDVQVIDNKIASDHCPYLVIAELLDN